MFAVRCSVLAALVADEVWRKRLVEAENKFDVERVVAEFAKAKGYVVAEVSQ
jgi:hypothetical protein